MSDVVTLYFYTSKYDLDSVIRALPDRQFVVVLESWTTSKDLIYKLDEKDDKPKKETRKPINVTEAVLIVNKESINSLRYFLKVKPHQNYYPREGQDPTSLYCVFTPSQKKETDRIVGLFCDKMKITKPKFIGNNGFSFYIFETDDYVPQIIGLLNSYPSLEGAKFRYGRKRGHLEKETPIKEQSVKA